MPNLKIEKGRFFELMGQKYQTDELDPLGFYFGIERFFRSIILLSK